MRPSTLLALIVRISIALFTRTVFQPDEYFQSLEPAHHAVFGYGHLTWEWLAQQPIRSIVYPALNVPIYWVLKITGLDKGWIGDQLVVAGPRILHGAFAAATDVWICELAKRVLGDPYVSTALFLSLTSFFHGLALSRSLSNSLETSLATIAFSFYPWNLSLIPDQALRKSLIFAALACAVRPTNAVIWIYLFGIVLWRLRSNKVAMLNFILYAAIVGAVTLSSIFMLDSVYYGTPTFTPYTFIWTNLSGISLFYGENPWHFYLFQAIPVLCTSALPFVLHGVWTLFFGTSISSSDLALKTMLGAVVWTISIYSLAAHKEWRFIHPLLPLLHIFAARSLLDLSRSRKSRPDSSKDTPFGKLCLPGIRTTYLGIILLTVPLSVCAILIYCSAPVSVLSYLQSLPPDELRHGGVGLLMPCHSTPGQAFLHREGLENGRMWALGCEPPLGLTDPKNYRDQTDIFFQSPYQYLQRHFPSEVDASFPTSPFPTSIPGAPLPVPPAYIPFEELSGSAYEQLHPWKHEWPKYLILFGALLKEEGVELLLKHRGYMEVWRKGLDWEGEGKRTGGVRVFQWVDHVESDVP